MINYIPYENINKQKWDACIDNSVNGIIYAYSWYLDNVCEHWDALVADDYEAVFPLVWNKKFGVYYLYPPYFSQQLGLFSNRQLSSGLLNVFLKLIPKKFRYFEIYLNTFIKPESSELKIVPRITYHLELIQEYESIYKNYSDNIKRNLKKAEKNNLQLVKNLKPEMLVELFQKNQGVQLKKINKTHYYSLMRIMYLLMHKGMGEIIGVYDGNNNLCAGGFFTRNHHKIINLFPATNDKARDIGAMFLLLDNLIKDNSAKNLILDFEGSMIESIARVYKGFGGKEINYWMIKKNELPWYMRIMKK